MKKWWGFGLAIAGAISGLTAYVHEVDADRDRRAEQIAAAISALRRDTSEDSRNLKLDSLGFAGLAEHLEPRAINGLESFIKARTRLTNPCVAVPTASPPPSDVNHAFRLIATFQGPNRGHHSYPDRLLDSFLAMWHGEPDVVELPPDLRKSNLRGVTLTGLRLNHALFAGSCLVDTHFDGAKLDSTRFDSTSIDPADFTKASLRSASFQLARGSQAQFDQADLTDANLNGASLHRARFFGTILSCATLGNARLDSAYFSSATAKWTFFGGATFAGATKLDEITDVTSAYLTGVRDLPAAILAVLRSHGAASDTADQAAWSAGRTSQLSPTGACPISAQNGQSRQ